MTRPFDLIGFDADDTLWHNEILYRAALERLIALMAPYASEKTVRATLDSVEHRNMRTLGYGIKAFVLSMIETAIEVSNGQVNGREIQEIMAAGKQMLPEKMLLLDGVEPTLADLARTYPLVLITKGDLIDQEAKVVRSGLAEYFSAVEIVSEKDEAAYRRILARHQVAPERFFMAGNSLKSDIAPVLRIGGSAVLVPYEHTWAAEMAVDPVSEPGRFFEVESLRQLPELLAQIANNRG